MASTSENTPFHIYKHNVLLASGLAVSDLDADRLSVSYDNGEPVETVAKVQQMLAQSRNFKTQFQSNMTACTKRVRVAA